MVLAEISSGVSTSFSTDLNTNFNNLLSIIGNTNIRTVINGATKFSNAQNDSFVEVADSITGALTTFSEADSTARWDGSDSWVPGINDVASGDTNHSDADGGTWSDVSNAFDNDSTTYAEWSDINMSSEEPTIGKTFAAKTVTRVYYKVWFDQSSCSSNDFRIQSYDGGTWSDEIIIVNNGSIDGFYYGVKDISSSVQGIRLYVNFANGGGSADPVFRVYQLEYETAMSSSRTYAEFDIPTGTFDSAVSSAFCNALVENYESGTTVDYELLNGSDTTGWISIDEISNFSAFSSGEPTKLRVGLTPKSSSPTNNYPSINGVFLVAK